MDKRDFYIDGQWVEPAKRNDHAVIDPSTEEPCAVISLGGDLDTDAAVAAARSAFSSWSQTSKQERIGLIENLLKVYEARAQEMAQTISMEMGAPVDFSLNLQVAFGKRRIQGFLDSIQKFEFEKDFTATEKTLLEPVGVCALITPWNWPMNQIVLKVVAAMLAGCTIVLKPSEIAPLSGMLFAEFMHEAGFPKGVFNLVNGDGTGVGTQLTAHPDIDMVSFTGSTRAGIAISKSAADTLKRVSLELGGKGANIIFEDAVANAAEIGAIRCFRNSGQSCNAPSRMLVHKSRYAEAVEMAAEAARNTVVGPSSETGGHIGPVASEAQFNKIQGLIEKGMEEARLVAGGLGRPEGMNRGYYVRPTVFAEVSNDMTIAREEIFGPVLSIIPFETEEEAISIANDTAYGLANYIQSTNSQRAHRVARRLRSGMVEINGELFAPDSPFGGYKQSGNGREGGTYGIHEFLEIKAVSGWHAS